MNLDQGQQIDRVWNLIFTSQQIKYLVIHHPISGKPYPFNTITYLYVMTPLQLYISVSHYLFILLWADKKKNNKKYIYIWY